jgi:hypothetical protein
MKHCTQPESFFSIVLIHFILRNMNDWYVYDF